MTVDTVHPDLKRLIEKTVSIPTIPSVLMRMDRVLASPDTCAADISRAVASDPALASKVLRIANSAFYGLKSSVTSLDLAVALLGFKVIRNIVVTASLLGSFGSATDGTTMDSEAFWRHSAQTATAGRVIHSRFMQGDSAVDDDAYTAGLLHDLGKLILLDRMKTAYIALLTRARASGTSLHLAEREELGYDHAQVGGLLAGNWNLPASVVAAISHHHDPADHLDEYKTVPLTHLADYVAKTRAVPAGFSGGPDPFVPECLGALGLEESDLSQIVFVFESEDKGIDMPF